MQWCKSCIGLVEKDGSEKIPIFSLLIFPHQKWLALLFTSLLFINVEQVELNFYLNKIFCSFWYIFKVNFTWFWLIFISRIQIIEGQNDTDPVPHQWIHKGKDWKDERENDIPKPSQAHANKVSSEVGEVNQAQQTYAYIYIRLIDWLGITWVQFFKQFFYG